MQVANWKMIAHPMNWATIFMMLVIVTIAGHLFLTLLGVEPSTNGKATTPAAYTPQE